MKLKVTFISVTIDLTYSIEINKILLERLGNRFQGDQSHVYEYAGETLNTVEGATTRTTGLSLTARIVISPMSECRFRMLVSIEEIFYHFLVMSLCLPFQPNLGFHIETSHLIYTANQMTGFYIECNTKLKWVKK